MGDLRAYDIPFTGLKNGEYDFLYEIDDSFFMSFQESPILNGDVTVNLAFDKKPNFFICKFDLKGSVITECDRCLGELDLNIILGQNDNIVIESDLITSSRDLIEVDIFFFIE